MSSTLLILSLIAAGVTGAPSDPPEAVFKSAIEDFEYGEHAAAAAKLRKILEPPQLASKEDVIVARQYLGACYHLLDEKEKAKSQFSLLLALDPKHKLDPEVFSPAVVSFFEQVRSEAGLTLEPRSTLADEVSKKRSKARAESRDDRDTKADARSDTKSEAKSDVKLELRPSTERPPSAALALVPFGVGQFANRHYAKGALFAVSEVGLFTAAAVTFSMFESLKNPAGQFAEADAGRADTLQTVYLSTFWVGVGVAAVGIVEALVSYPGDAAPPSPGKQASDATASTPARAWSVTPAGLSIGF